MTKILFISHDANRAGAQIVLLQLLQQLKKHRFDMHLLLCSDGELESEFRATLLTTRLPRKGDVVISPLFDRILNRSLLFAWLEKYLLQKRLHRLKNDLIAKGFNLIFANTIASAAVFRQLDYLTVPTVLFAHELEMSIKKFSHPDDMNYLMSRTKHLIVVAQAVARYYQKTYHHPADQISTFQIIDTPLILQKIEEGKKTDIRATLGLPSNAILIGGCGHAEWRKGNDIFMVLAQEVIKKLPHQPIYFVWVGMRQDTEIYEIQRFDAERTGLSDRIVHIDLTSQVFAYLSQFDVFALTSREDPYPLVVLEAALAEKPIVCFEQSGGAPELVEADAGFVVPYLDVNAMAKSVIELIENEPLRIKMGQTAKSKVLERHNTEQSVAKVINIIHQLCP